MKLNNRLGTKFEGFDSHKNKADLSRPEAITQTNPRLSIQPEKRNFWEDRANKREAGRSEIWVAVCLGVWWRTPFFCLKKGLKIRFLAGNLLLLIDWAVSNANRFFERWGVSISHQKGAEKKRCANKNATHKSSPRSQTICNRIRCQ